MSSSVSLGARAMSSSIKPSTASGSPRTLNVAYSRLLLEHLLARRPQAQALVRPEQLAWLGQQDPLARCTLAEWHELLNLAEGQLGASDLVPELAELFKPWHAGLVGFTLMTSHKVCEVGSLLRQFHSLLNDVFEPRTGYAGANFYLRLKRNSLEDSPRLARLSLCVWAQRLRSLTGRPDLQIDGRFRGPAPADVAPYRRIFGGQVRFEQDMDEMLGAVQIEHMPIVSHDAVSHSLLQAQASKHLQLLSSEDPLVIKLRRLIQERLDDGRLSLDVVAGALNMPARTLQRRLEEAGLNFRLLVDDARKAAAEHYLRDTNMPLAEMAVALGFADHASFNRAFKRWTGSSPGAFRRQQGAAAMSDA
jgi:AraC-like DNA-binding protein